MYITRDNKQYFEIPNILIGKTGMKYEVMEERLGCGGNAAVYNCINRSGEEVAIKFLLNVYEKSSKRFNQEIKVLKDMKHQNLIQYYDDGIIKATTKTSRTKPKEEVNIPFVVMEKADTNLRDYLKNRGKLRY